MEKNHILSASSILAQAGAIIDKHKTIVKETGGLFNIFSILNMERLEVQTHSSFIYELLNPRGSHSQGDIYLKFFLEEVLHIDDFVFKDVVVERERSIRSNGRLDLVIENDDILLIIEIKIDAGDQDAQLIRYDEYGKSRGKKYKIYYLTLFGNEASEQSSGGKGNGNGIDYTCLSFSSDILNWIKNCIRVGKTPLLPIIRETLIQYVRLLEKITNQIDGGLNMELKELLLKGDNLEIVEQLIKATPYAWAELEYKFWKEYYDTYNSQVEALGIKLIEDDFFNDKDQAIETIVQQRNRKGGDIIFEYSVGENFGQKINLIIGQSGYDKTVYMSFKVFEKNEQIHFSKWNKQILSNIIDLGFSLSSTMNKYRYLNTNINFYDISSYKLLGEKSFDGTTKLIGEEILEIFKTIKKNKVLCK